MLIISSREFREKQAEYMDKVDNGEQVIIQRGKTKAYSLSPITEEDVYFTPQVLQKIDISIKQAQEGKVTNINSEQDLIKYLDSL